MSPADDRPKVDSSAPPSRLELVGGRLVVFVLAAALVGTWMVRDRPLTSGEWLVVVASSVGYLLLAMRAAPLAERSLGMRRLYFFCQLAFVAAILVAFARAGAFGTAWLLAMPLVAEATLVLPMLEFAVVGFGALGVIELQAFLLGGWRTVTETTLPLALATAFVVLFTRLARRESEARAHSETLRVRSEVLRAELAEANRHLVDYAAQAESLATERERSRLAGEIHDGLGHALTVVTVQIEAALAILEREPDEARTALERAANVTRRGLADVRRSVAALRASPLDGRSLEEALGELARSPMAVEVDFVVCGRPRSVPPAVEQALYRAAQEALTNVYKHSGASTARLELDFGDDAKNRRVKLTVSDDGTGSTPNERVGDGGGYGLWSVERRAERLGGAMDFETSPTGSTLHVEVPG